MLKVLVELVGAVGDLFPLRHELKQTVRIANTAIRNTPSLRTAMAVVWIALLALLLASRILVYVVNSLN